MVQLVWDLGQFRGLESGGRTSTATAFRNLGETLWFVDSVSWVALARLASRRSERRGSGPIGMWCAHAGQILETRLQTRFGDSAEDNNRQVNLPSSQSCIVSAIF